MHPVKAVPTRCNPFVHGEKPQKTHSSIKPTKTQKKPTGLGFLKNGFFKTLLCDFAAHNSMDVLSTAIYYVDRELLVVPFSPAQSQRISQYFNDLMRENDNALPTTGPSVELSTLSPPRPLLISSQSADSVVVTSEFLLLSYNSVFGSIDVDSQGLEVLAEDASMQFLAVQHS